MIKNFIDTSGIECYEDVSLKKYNTYKIDAKAKYLVFPKDSVELISLISYLKDNNCKFLVLGNGSNVIFNFEYYDGVIIRLDRFNSISINDNVIEVGAGYSLIKLANEVALLGLSGLEFASGIPGCVGASVAMNAGAYNHSLAEVVESVMVLTPDNEIITMNNEELEFNYRESFLKHNKDYIILSCKIILSH